MKNRHQPQSPMYFADWDKRLCAESRAVVAAARQGEFAMRRLLNEPSVKGGIPPVADFPATELPFTRLDGLYQWTVEITDGQ